jgi:TetR/AcrR family transcriptional regulator
MPRPARVSPDRILAAAALEFAERGFAGARVDRIARRAHINKAMIYYHFKDKQALYRTLLRRTFGLAAERLQAIASSDAAPAEKLDRTLTAFAALIREQSFFPAIMLREVAEGGAHLDRDTLAVLASVPRAVGAIVAEGVAAGVFREVNPLFAYFSMVTPIVFFLCAAPIRQELGALHLVTSPSNDPDEFVRHMQESARRALAHGPVSVAKTVKRPKR